MAKRNLRVDRESGIDTAALKFTENQKGLKSLLSLYGYLYGSGPPEFKEGELSKIAKHLSDRLGLKDEDTVWFNYRTHLLTMG